MANSACIRRVVPVALLSFILLAIPLCTQAWQATTVEERLARAESEMSNLNARMEQASRDAAKQEERLHQELDRLLRVVEIAALVATVLVAVVGWFANRSLRDLSARLERGRQTVEETARTATRDLEETASGLVDQLRGESQDTLNQVKAARAEFDGLIAAVGKLARTGAPIPTKVKDPDELRILIEAPAVPELRLAFLRAAAELEPGGLAPPEYYNYGVGAENLGAPGLGVQLFRRAYEDSRKDPEYGRAYAQTLARVGRTDESIGVFEELIQAWPTYAPVYAFYIDALRMARRFQEAQDLYYKRAGEQVREAAIVLREMASMLEDVGDYQRGLEFAKAAVAKDPSDVVGHGLCSRLHFALGNFAEAEEAARKAVASADSSTPERMVANSLSFLAYALKGQQKYEEAARIFRAERMARTWDGSRGDLWERLSGILAGREDVELAEPRQSSALQEPEGRATAMTKRAGENVSEGEPR